MRFATPLIAALPLAAIAAALAAHAASPWAGSADTPDRPGGTTVQVIQQLSCSAQNPGTALTYTVTDTSPLPTPAGLSAITLCNARQPNGPPPPAGNPNLCGSIGSISMPALQRGKSYSWTTQLGYHSTTPPTCTAANVVVSNVN